MGMPPVTETSTSTCEPETAGPRRAVVPVLGAALAVNEPASISKTTAARTAGSFILRSSFLRALRGSLTNVRVRLLRDTQLPLQGSHARLRRIPFPDHVGHALAAVVVPVDAHAHGLLRLAFNHDRRVGRPARGWGV